MTDEEYYSVEKDLLEYVRTGNEEIVPLFKDYISVESLKQRSRTEPHYGDLRKLYDLYEEAKEKWENVKTLAKEYAESYAAVTGLNVLALQCKKLEEQLKDCKEAKVEPQQRTKKDIRRNFSVYFNEPTDENIEKVKSEATGKTGAALCDVFKKYIKTGVMNGYPSYGSLVKDCDFPNDTKAEKAYKVAKSRK